MAASIQQAIFISMKFCFATLQDFLFNLISLYYYKTVSYFSCCYISERTDSVTEKVCLRGAYPIKYRSLTPRYFDTCLETPKMG